MCVRQFKYFDDFSPFTKSGNSLFYRQVFCYSGKNKLDFTVFDLRTRNCQPIGGEYFDIYSKVQVFCKRISF